MYGSWYGDITAILFFMAFQLIGFFCANKLLYRQSIALRLLIGSVAGSVMLQWLPALFSLVLGFNLLSHILGLLLAALLVPVVYRFVPANGEFIIKRQDKKELWALALIVPVYALFAVMLLNHTIPIIDGAVHTGQCTYGDMNMHLGFITSVAVQGTFPPEYSILPGTALNYPFLCDTISSSMYVFGCSLRLAYIWPMLFACAQVFAGFYLLARAWCASRNKAMLAWTLFFLCGGFGFSYFFDDLLKNPDNFWRIFTEFYNTPTNLVTEGNIRWVNVIADMLLPQRATLFGWAVLFPVLTLLYKATFKGENGLYLPAAVLAGALPMIHTHSFLALGIICACWLLWTLKHNVEYDRALLKGVKSTVLYAGLAAGAVLLVYGYTLAFPSGIPEGFLKNSALISQAANNLSGLLVPVLLAGLLLPLCACVYLLAVNVRRGKGRALLGTWGMFLIIVLVLAVPQLIKWTFAQVSGGSMLNPSFNWGNTRDTYIWYYVKNIGLVGLLALPALIGKRRTMFKVAAPALLIWFIAELIVFQPNPYDNNKLLYPAYALICCVVASYLCDIYNLLKEKGIGGRRIMAVGVIIACTLSAVLTLGREVVSDYELYGSDQLAACEYIQSNTPADAVFLTETRHNNAVSSLTGRNIVCGSGTFLYFHGVGYQQRESAVEEMFLDIGNTELLNSYGVDYIFVSNYELSKYRGFSESTAAEKYKLVYDEQGVRIYAVSERAIKQEQ